ncbi:NAD(P)-dependent dehydrogenase (short-subunit alcohol dehydrogenase family) [Catenuloplanes nepalensis]|uniref:NAD(P)-dependent dehydrogenase (Short-subunit alcohol dehydrogenase family) n=1 Tax=Catenuloplanes nepalensis TaxID=587533 RepID=A0ABT9N0N6_9ACTN|nr:SDR family oxidoreductase [Catenuloplanes nepalensis]MDP9797258.1 NAD(P)-dependent dehydrogenase (short-subunit alcohol dehydrogenase family) [Catenuloplanes nepalensis]
MPEIALITGGNRGLGRAYALALAEAGVDLILTYRTPAKDAIEAVLAEARGLGRTAVAIPLDTREINTFDQFTATVREALRTTWERDDFDFLLNNAGTGPGATIADTTVEMVDEVFAVHFRGPFFLTQKLLPLIADGGRILNFSTGLSRFTGEGLYSAYGAMKGAVEVFTRYLAKEVAPRGISANVIAAGATATEFAGGGLLDENVGAYIGTQTARGRIGRPADIAGVVVAMLTGDTGWVTAQRIEASGGMLI